MIPNDSGPGGHPPPPPRPELPDLAAAHRRGPAAAVEAKWEALARYWRWMAGHRRQALRPGGAYPGACALVEAARAVPELRRLYPFTSHLILKFSSTTTFPYDVRLPSVEPLADGRFRVRRHLRGAPVIGEPATPGEALAL
ncbi:DUF6193 family natural product biosynthesis protein, partial [Streptomyces sp. NPDC031705]|uniref:DUF6193 family natural product biosynthesis protein n=1 Tax=Streptomyces sp. NPDC031705 TaxID=3155729 RepID=UPI0033F24E42